MMNNIGRHNMLASLSYALLCNRVDGGEDGTRVTRKRKREREREREIERNPNEVMSNAIESLFV